MPVPLKDLECSFHQISFMNFELQIGETMNVKMYPCPSIMYLDMVTGEFVLLRVGNFISGTNDEESFMYYSRENSLSPIYPKKRAFNAQLELDLLDHLVQAQKFAEFRSEKLRRSMTFETQESQIEKRFADATRIREMGKSELC